MRRATRSLRAIRRRSLCGLAFGAALLPLTMARAQAASTRAAAATAPDWSVVRDETVRHLRRLIQLNTVNPPGNEITVARYLDSTLRAAGIETHLFEPSPGRAAFVARLRGTGATKPVLLMAHMDVVGVERDQWSVDPFAAVEKDGYIYGRGAIDDKGMLAANLVTMLLLKRHVIDAGGTLTRDVVLVANSDEEAGGDWGMGWLIANQPELIRAEFAVNEGGRTRIVDGRPLYVAVQNTEKVSHNVRVVATGPGGHASVPLPGNAIGRLARALATISEYREPVQLNPTTRAFFSALSEVWPNAAEKRAMADVASRDARRVERGARVLSAIPIYDAVLRNGISLTLIDGGIRTNVIPTEATANLNIRTLPGESIDSLVKRLRRVVGDSLVRFEIDRDTIDAPASSFRSPMFVAIADAVRTVDSTMTVVPYMSTGATDSARLRAWGVQTYGILPFPLAPEDEERMHGNDERVPVAALLFGVKVIYLAMLNVAG
ncbi:MAG: M20/M25/M40 family metallo-hydrolase [Gemmatimonadota bacterium]|nr:M20/M25/M40 family metallo-hydrolase [Gemmatimonadota bacterium]